MRRLCWRRFAKVIGAASPMIIIRKRDSSNSSPPITMPRTKAVIVVHFGGYPVDLDAVLAVTSKHGLLLIEDCAHAQGTSWRGRKANDPAYDHHISASNWRLGGLQTALLLSQFSRMPEQAEQRHANYVKLVAGLSEIEGITCLPTDERITQYGCYFTVFDFDAEKFGCSRRQFVDAMRSEGVAWCTTGYNRPLYKERAFVAEQLRPLLHREIKLPDYVSIELPYAEKWTSRMVTILHFYLLGDDSGVTHVLRAVRKIKEHVNEFAAIGG